MEQRVAVENNLHHVKDYLGTQGYTVVNLDPISSSRAELQNCQAIVVNGYDTNMLGMEDIQTQSTVIDATGKTPAEIHQQIQTTFTAANATTNAATNSTTNTTASTMTNTMTNTAADTTTNLTNSTTLNALNYKRSAAITNTNPDQTE